MIYFSKPDEELVSSGSSRDPLGLQPVWSHFGRQLIPSLTTVSTRSHHFSRLLVSLYCRDRWLEEHQDTRLSGTEPILIFEVLHAYSLRSEYDDIGDTPGKRRVEINWKETKGDPDIGYGPGQQILRNQAGVGISGRYFTPLVRMGIVNKEGRLTADVPIETLFSQEVVTLQRAVTKVLAMIEETSKPQPYSRFPKSARRLMTTLLPRDGHITQEEIDFWKKRIGIAGDQHPLVRRCAEYLRQIPENAEHVTRTVIEHLLQGENDSKCRQIVESIRDCEVFIAPLQKLFDELYNSGSLPRFEDSPKTHAWREQLKRARPAFLALRIEGHELGRRYRSLLEIDVDGKTPTFANTLIRHHQGVAEGKGGTPWIAMEGTKAHALNAAYTPWDWKRMDETTWTNSYYMGSLRSILRGLDQEGA